MSDDEATEETTDTLDPDTANRHKEGLGERLHHAERSVERAVKDTLTAAEIRLIQAGEAETSGSPEVNFAAAVEVALNPPHPEEADAGARDEDGSGSDDEPEGGPDAASGHAGGKPEEKPAG